MAHDSAMTVEWLERDGARIAVRCQIAGIRPDGLWQLWTTPEGLTRWWPQKAEIDPAARSLHFSWPRMGWHLRGRVLAWEPSRRLVFTWRWDHEPELPERTVTVELMALAGGDGTVLTLEHGTYGDGAIEAADRQSHIEGWDHFLGRLESATRGAS
jgi:uncharacterized protein YndB with AHSA1/START domain